MLHKVILLGYTETGWKYGAGKLPVEVITGLRKGINSYRYHDKTGKKKAAMIIKQKLIKVYQEDIKRLNKELAQLITFEYAEQQCLDVNLETLYNN